MLELTFIYVLQSCNEIYLDTFIIVTIYRKFQLSDLTSFYNIITVIKYLLKALALLMLYICFLYLDTGNMNMHITFRKV